MSACHLQTLHQRTNHHALAESRHDRAAHKRLVPKTAVAFYRLKAKFKRHATENQGNQHQAQRHHQGFQNHCISQWKRTKQSRAAQYQPRFIAIPHRCHGVYHGVAVGQFGRERHQNAYAQVKTIHHNVHQGAKHDDDKPYQGQIQSHVRLLNVVDGCRVPQPHGLKPQSCRWFLGARNCLALF